MPSKAVLVHAYQGIIDAVWVFPDQEAAEAVLNDHRTAKEVEGRCVFDTNLAPKDAILEFAEREEYRLFTCEEGSEADTSVICRSLFTA
jgi:hypothetical protein